MIDGCGNFGVLRNVIVPMAKARHCDGLHDHGNERVERIPCCAHHADG